MAPRGFGISALHPGGGSRHPADGPGGDVPRADGSLHQGGCVRVDAVHFNVPMGERILINDTKPSGLTCAHAVAPTRDEGLEGLRIVIDPEL